MRIIFINAARLAGLMDIGTLATGLIRRISRREEMFCSEPISCCAVVKSVLLMPELGFPDIANGSSPRVGMSYMVFFRLADGRVIGDYASQPPSLKEGDNVKLTYKEYSVKRFGKNPDSDEWILRETNILPPVIVSYK
jgi:hypothetical protein